MKKTLFCLSLLLVTNSITFGQEITLTSTDEMVNQSNTAFFSSFLGENENGYFMLRKGGPISNEEILIEKYTPTLKYVSTIRVKSATGVMGDGKLHRLTMMDHGKIFHFYDGWHKESGMYSLILQRSDENGAPIEEDIVLEKEKSPNQMNAADYKYVFSPDGTKLAVLTSKPFVKDSKEKMRIQVFSTVDFSSIWSKDIELETASAKYPSNDFSVNNLGVVGLFKDVKISNKEHLFQWIAIDSKGHQVSALDLKNNFPAYHKLLIDSEGKFIVSGMLTALGNARSTWQNIMFVKAGTDGKLMITSVEPIGSDVIKMIANEKAAANPEYKVQDYVLKDIVLTSDNGIYLVAEHQTSSQTAVGTAQPPVYDYTLNYGGVLLLAIDNQGKRKWNTYYNKTQKEVTRDKEVTYGSFVLTVKNDKVFMIWNYTNFEREPLNGKRYWLDKSGAKIYLDLLFGPEAIYPTLCTVINKDGTIGNGDKTFMSVALKDIQLPNAYAMAIDPAFFIQSKEGVIVMSRMAGKAAKRYKFSTIKLE